MKQRKQKEKSLAKEELKILFNRAEKVFKQDKLEANRLVSKARRLAMKNRIKLPSIMQRKFCKHCYSFLIPGINLRIRTHSGHVVYYCMECKRFMRFPYRKKVSSSIASV